MNSEVERAGLKLIFYLISDPKVSQLIEAIEEFEEALEEDASHRNDVVTIEDDGVTVRGRMLRPFLSDRLQEKNR